MEQFAVGINEHPESVHMAVVCILSHGSKQSVYGYDGKPIKIDKLLKRLDNQDCPGLRNKPKLILIQACRGSKLLTKFK